MYIYFGDGRWGELLGLGWVNLSYYIYMLQYQRIGVRGLPLVRLREI